MGSSACADVLEHAGALQRVNAAIRQRQIDGPARALAAPRRGSGRALVQFHRVSAALQQEREQRAGGARADDANHTPIQRSPAHGLR